MENIIKVIKGLGIAIILFSAFSLHAQLADTPWPMFRHDPQHTGRSPYVVPESLEIVWTFETKKPINNEPIIGVDGTIYVVSYYGPIYALQPDGSVKWQFEIGGSGNPGFTTSPVISANSIIYVAGAMELGEGASALYAINKDGKLEWKYVLSKMGYNYVYSSPALSSDGTIYVGTMEDTLYAINQKGTLKWKYGIADPIASAPAIGYNGNIYFVASDNDGSLYSIKPNGTFAWKYQVIDDPYWPSYQIHPVIASDGTIYCTYQPYSSVEVELQAINPNGTLKWKSDLAGEMISLGASGNIYFSDGMSYLYSLLPNGEMNWKTNQNADFISIDNNEVSYVGIGPRNNAPGRNPDTLYTINPNGTLRWKIGLGNKLTSSPVIDSDGTIYIAVESSGPNKGKLLCLKASKTGTPDLAVGEVYFDPVDGTNVGAEINVSAVIKDLSNTSSARCLVSFYYDNKENLIDTVSVYIPYGGDATARVKWYTQNYEPRNYQVIVEISNATPNETNVDNNTYTIIYPIYPTIQSRINSAQSGDTVWVEPGTYFENIRLKDDVIVKSKMGPEKTILNGKGVASTVTAEWLQNSASLNGFTITNGKGVPYGGGVYIYRGGATIRNNIIKNNSAAQGGGIFIIGIINPSYPNNPLIFQNIITGNDADRGEAILTNNSQARIWNNTIVANGEIVNGQRTGDGIWSEGVYYPTPDIKNCIIWDNGDDMTGNPYAGGALATYSCIEDGDAGEGNISQNPLFVDSENGNFHLQPNSPCINAGDPNPIFNDQDGSRNDMGAYGGSYSVLTGIEELNAVDEILLNSFHLFQNYPNPFNSSTIIRFTIPKASQFELSIFNIQGQLIKTLFNKKVKAGIHSVSWDGMDSQGKHVASGLYIYSLTSSEFQKSNKMILIR